MATLKDHQQAMVDLLASGSGIPASASRLAHAMHDVLGFLSNETMHQKALDIKQRIDATTPGLNDKALAADVEACRPKAKPTATEQRIRELENTIRQLRQTNAKQKATIKDLRDDIGDMASKLHALQSPEQAGCRKPDTQECEHLWQQHLGDSDFRECIRCGVVEDLY